MPVKRCGCTNHWQDKRYGVGMRVVNRIKPKSREKAVYRCTACGKEVM